MWILSEEEINKDLKYNFPGIRITFSNLVKPGNPFYAQSREEARIGYTCGNAIRDFFIEENLKLNHAARGLLPLVFNVYRASELYKILGDNLVRRGLDDLKNSNIINFEKVMDERKVERRVVFYVNNFENIGNYLRIYKGKRGYDKFKEELGLIEFYVNRISERSREVYENAIRWFKEHLDLKKFEFKPRPLFLELQIEESLTL